MTFDYEKVIEAARLIDMHDVILGFPDGYDTVIGDSGYAPSGGQRQRLAIARAIYGMPKFVVMDEPNSNLDESGETALINCVMALKESGGTVIITTHRPRLVNVVDMMLVLRDGQQVAFGKAQDILEAVRRLQVIPAEEAGVRAGPGDPAGASGGSLVGVSGVSAGVGVGAGQVQGMMNQSMGHSLGQANLEAV